jgi:hypothetical protein
MMISAIADFQRNSRKLRTYPGFEYLCDIQEHIKMFTPTLNLICAGFNRANGFLQREDENSEDEHWSFSAGDTEKLQLQAINCNLCGEYIHTNCIMYCDIHEVMYMAIPERCLCCCEEKLELLQAGF